MRSAHITLMPLLLLVGACARNEPGATALPSATLQPFQTAEPTSTATFPVLTLEVVATPGPSPTPFIHQVRSGETLLGIALLYGVELDDLLLANPGVNPRFLSIGQELLIPGPQGAPAPGLLPTPTAIPIQLSPVRCYGSAEGRLWCLVTASSDLDSGVEGLVALVTLADAQGMPMRTEPAYSPVNLLQPGGRLPLLAVFDPPVPELMIASSDLLSAVPASDTTGRYAQWRLTIDESGPLAGSHDWRVQGRLELAGGSPEELESVTLLIMAMDLAGEVVGFKTQALEPGRQIDFDLYVTSLGPDIASVDLIAEALTRP